MTQIVSAIENSFLNITLNIQFIQCFFTIRLFTKSDSFQKLNKISLNYVNIFSKLHIISIDKRITISLCEREFQTIHGLEKQ